MILAAVAFVIVPSTALANPLKICQQCPNNPSQCEPNCAPPPPPYDLIAFYSAANAPVCVNGGSPVYNEGDLYIEQGVQVTISACDMPGGSAFDEWLTNAGTLGSPLSATTTFTPESTNSMWLVTSYSGSPNRAGYVLDYSGMTATSISAKITVPTSVTWIPCYYATGGHCEASITIPGYGTLYNAEVEALWVGLEGSDTIWQAGIDVIAGTNILGLSPTSVAVAWYEEYTSPSSSQTLLYNSIGIGFGNTVNVDVMQASSTSAYYYFYDYANSEIDQGYVSFDAPTTYADWLLESPTYIVSGISSFWVMMPSSVPSVPTFASPTVSYTCSSYCPLSTSNFEGAVYADTLSLSYANGLGSNIGESATPSQLTSPYTSFTEWLST